MIPLVYLAHMAEEIWGGEGYVAYTERMHGVHIDPQRLLLLDGLAIALLVVGVLLARRFGFQKWMLLILGTLALINGIRHTITTITTAAYNPGVVTGLAIFIPFGVLVLVRMKRVMRNAEYLAALSIGVGIQVGVTILALRGGKI